MRSGCLIGWGECIQLNNFSWLLLGCNMPSIRWCNKYKHKDRLRRSYQQGLSLELVYFLSTKSLIWILRVWFGNISVNARVENLQLSFPNGAGQTSSLLLQLINTESVASNIFEIHIPSTISLYLLIATGCTTELLNSLLGLSFCQQSSCRKHEAGQGWAYGLDGFHKIINSYSNPFILLCSLAFGWNLTNSTAET